MRGEEGYLLNNRGERFMKNYHEKMELALRDVVARVTETEIAKVEVMSRDLELMFCAMYTTLGKEKILKDLPKIRHTAMLFENIDLVDTLVLIRLTRIILWVELKWLNLKI
ncbi:FAD-binding protein [Campylobacter jejuni]|uniref:FAD-binding protein n=1 Tax=Campylobacter jejuni TaxID=197 RepID=UPI001F09EA87|nr:FAD-binding protein [Campylobacter jejuni]MCH3879001.1 FAD-binding protein [Campylobacter jejuni]MCH3879631.1 FAD-binding protein [Campylobacter jejuni]